MARRIFYSFHFNNDCWRTNQVRNIGVIEGNKPCSGNDWEEVKRGGDPAIERWIDSQLQGRSCTVVLIGSETANRKWVRREIVKSWDSGMGVLAINIHRLLDQSGSTSTKGENPLDRIGYGNTGRKLSSVAKTYEPPYANSQDVYSYIANNISSWIDEAVLLRERN